MASSTGRYPSPLATASHKGTRAHDKHVGSRRCRFASLAPLAYRRLCALGWLRSRFTGLSKPWDLPLPLPWAALRPACGSGRCGRLHGSRLGTPIARLAVFPSHARGCAQPTTDGCRLRWGLCPFPLPHAPKSRSGDRRSQAAGTLATHGMQVAVHPAMNPPAIHPVGLTAPIANGSRKATGLESHRMELHGCTRPYWECWP